MSGLVGVSSVGSSSALKNAVIMSSAAKGKARSANIEEEEEEVPILMNSEYKDMRSVLDKADVVLHVVDAREPLACYSNHLREYVGGKDGNGKLAVVLNKIGLCVLPEDLTLRSLKIAFGYPDTCPREVVNAWLSRLRREVPLVFPFRSASAFLPQAQDLQQNLGKSRQSGNVSQKDAVGTTALLDFLASEAAGKKEGRLQVAIVGVANVCSSFLSSRIISDGILTDCAQTGKSSLVNSLLRKSASPIYRLTSAPTGPSTTERPLELTLTHNEREITLIDTPALPWEHAEDLDGGAIAKLRASDMLLRSKGRIDKAKEPIVPGMFSMQLSLVLTLHPLT